jgi:hypothetical protein
MKEEQKIYIQGNQKRGDEIIKILIDLGGRNSHSMDGKNTNAYYFINPNGIIANSYSCGDNVFSFVREFYKEVKLPKWKPKYKESYYRINWQGAIVADIWHDTQDEEICYEFGNCFKTYEEAKEASRKIEEMLSQ